MCATNGSYHWGTTESKGIGVCILTIVIRVSYNLYNILHYIILYNIIGVQCLGKLLWTDGMRCPENVTFDLVLKDCIEFRYLEISIRTEFPVSSTQHKQCHKSENTLAV